jgi:Putative transposase of IS4/5 family (DUF4096)
MRLIPVPPDEQWNFIGPFLPELARRKDGRRRPWRENRAVFNGILWILRTGAPETADARRSPVASLPTEVEGRATFCLASELSADRRALRAIRRELSRHATPCLQPHSLARFMRWPLAPLRPTIQNTEVERATVSTGSADPCSFSHPSSCHMTPPRRRWARPLFTATSRISRARCCLGVASR